ncbi:MULTISPECIES: GPR1/FUN34/YaaH family transporter [Saliphagus]|uniref:GPR1/FUN34/YaaH family transporter n=1 Tax=Saliphagus infecundisoli TaxID=1849069 RepID=A0ABD5QHN9_9EURY|nr:MULTISPECIES: GPR1/FUN34/YaaH family transporter [Saliphagus]
MKRDTVAFGASFLTLAVGLGVLVAGIFQGGLTTLAVGGGAIVVAGVVGLYVAVAGSAGA